MATRKPAPAKKPAAKAAPAPRKSATKKAGRPSQYTVEVADRICTLIATDDTSLREICKAHEMPHRSTVDRWLAEHEEFAAKYARAREVQADVIFEGMRDIERKVLTRKLAPNAARVVLNNQQWRAAKLAAKRYGDKIQVGGAADLPPIQSKHFMSDDALVAIAAAALKKA